MIFLTKWLIFDMTLMELFVASEPTNNIGALLKCFWDLDFWLESPYPREMKFSLKNAMIAQHVSRLHIVDYNKNLRYSSVTEEGLIRTWYFERNRLSITASLDKVLPNLISRPLRYPINLTIILKFWNLRSYWVKIFNC